jgi:hypothetical protein
MWQPRRCCGSVSVFCTLRCGGGRRGERAGRSRAARRRAAGGAACRGPGALAMGPLPLLPAQAARPRCARARPRRSARCDPALALAGNAPHGRRRRRRRRRVGSCGPRGAVWGVSRARRRGPRGAARRGARPERRQRGRRRAHHAAPRTCRHRAAERAAVGRPRELLLARLRRPNAAAEGRRARDHRASRGAAVLWEFCSAHGAVEGARAGVQWPRAPLARGFERRTRGARRPPTRWRAATRAPRGPTARRALCPRKLRCRAVR